MNHVMRKRTKFGAAVVVTVANLGGCGITTSNPPPPSPDTGNPPPPALRAASYDVVVGAESVALLPRYATDDPSCRPSGVHEFPAIGECTTEGDAQFFPCGNAVTELAQVSIDGIAATADPATARFGLAVEADATSLLSLTGAFGPVDLPLHASGLPTPTVTATEVATGYDIAWTTDLPPASSVIDLTVGLAVQHCHVTLQSYGYVGDPSAVIGVRVQPLLPVETHATDYGEFRVWRGNGRYLGL